MSEKKVTPSESWQTLDPGHPVLPLRLQAPAELTTRLLDLGDEVTYVVSTPGDASATLLISADEVTSAQGFAQVNQELNAEVQTESRRVKLGGRIANETCGEIRTSMDSAVVSGKGGEARGVPAHEDVDVFRYFYVKVGGRTLRLGYRMPQDETDEWQPVLDAVLESVEWKKA